MAQSIAQVFDINVSTLIGGKTKKKMLDPPIEYTDILVTTLGAYSKLVTTGIYKIDNVHHVVLDEADTLLDDSFLDKLAHLLRKFSVSILGFYFKNNCKNVVSDFLQLLPLLLNL